MSERNNICGHKKRCAMMLCTTHVGLPAGNNTPKGSALSCYSRKYEKPQIKSLSQFPLRTLKKPQFLCSVHGPGGTGESEHPCLYQLSAAQVHRAMTCYHTTTGQRQRHERQTSMDANTFMSEGQFRTTS
ncbi:hypothetical protein AMECASPLE_012748 [Ameca splendens]|uniref:Uncharacterized protein n=1 Tax=Ameca splendens TaxID=208324 RepID=A0ABV1A7H5_9TELE